MEAEKELRKSGATSFNLGEAVKKQEALDSVKRRSEVQDPGFVAKIQKELSTSSSNRLEWRMPSNLDQLMKENPGYTQEQVIAAAQREKLKKAVQDQVLRAFPTAQYVKGQGWIVGNELVVRFQ
jgi:hypothetical protein